MDSNWIDDGKVVALKELLSMIEQLEGEACLERQKLEQDPKMKKVIAQRAKLLLRAVQLLKFMRDDDSPHQWLH